MNEYIKKYLKSLSILYPDRNYVWQPDNTQVFERILENGCVIMETLFCYFPETNVIDPKSGKIRIYLYQQIKEVYNYEGLIVEDPYAKEFKKLHSLDFSLTGSEWAINKCVPFLYNTNEDIFDKIKLEISKTNEILKDFQ